MTRLCEHKRLRGNKQPKRSREHRQDSGSFSRVQLVRNADVVCDVEKGPTVNVLGGTVVPGVEKRKNN